MLFLFLSVSVISSLTALFSPKIKVTVIVGDEQLEMVTAAILANSKTDRVGDGMIWVTDLVVVARIRTGEHGEEAV